MKTYYKLYARNLAGELVKQGLSFDGTCIPANPDNADYVKALAEIEAGEAELLEPPDA